MENTKCSIHCCSLITFADDLDFRVVHDRILVQGRRALPQSNIDRMRPVVQFSQEKRFCPLNFSVSASYIYFSEA